MIQSFNAAPQPVSMTAAEPVPLPAAQPQQAVDPSLPLALGVAALPPNFSDELLETGEVLAEVPEAAPLPDVLAATAPAQTDPASEPQDPAALTPELWLLSMLGQQNLQVQAQDAQAATPEPVAAVQVASTPAPAARLQELVPADPVPAQATEAPRVARATSDLPEGQQPAVPQQPSVDPTQGQAAPAERAALTPLPGLHSEAPRQQADAAAPTARPAQFDRTLSLHGSEARWGEQMLNALRDSVELQLGQRVQNATIRLDPPELGSLEILLRHESGQLHVQISAGQADVARALQGTSERLRQELVGQNFLQVSVQVSSDGQQGQGQHQPRTPFFAEEAPLAARESGEGAGQGAKGPASDVLVTV